MPQKPLSKEKRARVIELYNQGCYKNIQIAEMAGCAIGTVANVIRSLPADKLLKDLPPSQPDRIDEFAAFHKEKFQELLHRYKKWIGDTGSFKEPTFAGVSPERIAVANDLHNPFMHEQAFGAFLRREKGKAKKCILAGDVLDFWGVSKYPKSKQHFSLVEEFQSARAAIRTIAESFEEVSVLSGNHDDRWIKYLVNKGVPPDVLEFMRMAYPHSDSPLAKICADFPNVKVLPAKKIDYASFPFISQVGDCVISHAEKFSRVSMKATADVVDWLKSYAEPMGIVQDVKFIIQAHTHMAGKSWFGYGVVGIEAGCMARTPDYAGNAQLRGGSKPPVVGYSVLIQRNGITDVNESNFYQLA